MEKDLIIHNGSQFQASGTVAQRLLANGMNTSALRLYEGKDGRSYMTVIQNGKPVAVPVNNASTLRKDEWKHYDTVVVEAARQRMVGVQDLLSRGLVYNIPNGMGSTVLEYEDIGDISEADLDMDGISPGQKDRPIYSIKYLPLPIIHKDYHINGRVLAASRTTGNPLDTTMAGLAATKVMEKVETILFQGASSYAFGGGTIYGYVDHPYRNGVTLSENWDAAGKTGAEIVQDALNMKQASINDYHYGPWVMYVPTAYETVLDGDYDTSTPGTTIRERILKIKDIEDIKVVDLLAANNVLMVEMKPNVVRMVVGMPVTPIEWSTDGNMLHNFKVMTIMVPQIRADQNNRTGIIHLAA